jgi:hypothetical protein
VNVRIGGVWRYATPWVRVGGVWREARPWVRVGGVWKMMAEITLTGATIADTDTFGSLSSSAQLNVNSNGTVTADVLNDLAPPYILAADDWVVPKDVAPSDYEVRATLNSGSLSSGTVGSWLALTSNRSWSVSAVGSSSSQTADLTLEIRQGANVLASAVYSLSASVP